MATGASTADLAVVVVDATAGLREQTRRHCCIAALLGVRHMLVAVNKMDLADWDEAAYRCRRRRVRRAGSPAWAWTALPCIPVSALHGDNVVAGFDPMPRGTTGPTLSGGLGGRPRRGLGPRRRRGGPPPGPVGGAPAREGTQLRRHGDRWHAPARGRGGRAARRAAQPASPRSRPSTDPSTKPGPHVGHGAASTTTSTSAAATCWPRRQTHPRCVREFDATLCWFAPARSHAGERFRLKHTTRVTPAEVVAVRLPPRRRHPGAGARRRLGRQRHRRGPTGRRPLLWPPTPTGPTG